MEHEEEVTPNLYDVPITISRYCDPFCNEKATKHSVEAMTRILDKGGQVILRTATTCIPAEAWEIMRKHGKNIQFQARVITAATNTGDIVREQIAPGFASTKCMYDLLGSVRDYVDDVALYFDPYIIGLNDSDLRVVVSRMELLGLKKIIIRQLFATERFKQWLIQNAGPRHQELLVNKIGDYWTYDNVTFTESLVPALFSAQKNEIDVSVCGNRAVNTLVCDHHNCCMFSEACAVYSGGCTKRPNIEKV